MQSNILFEMEVISNKTIVNVFAEKANDDIKKKFVGVFPSNYVIRFINFNSMMIESKSNYPSMIMNIDQSDKKGTHFLGITYKKRNLFI